MRTNTTELKPSDECLSRHEIWIMVAQTHPLTLTHPQLSPDLTLSHHQQQQRSINEQQQEQHLLKVRDDFLFHTNFDQIV